MQFCPWETAKYFFFSSNVPSLLYYSHGIAIVSSLILGFLILYKSKKILSAKIFSIITILFSLWVLLDLYLWAQNDISNVLFFWSLVILIEPLIYIFAAYFIDVFNERKDISFTKKIIFFSLVIPIIITLSTPLNLIGIDPNSCVAIEGFIPKYYTYAIELISVIMIFFYSIKSYNKTKDQVMRKQIFFSTIGVLFFLLAFSFGNIIGSFSDQWEYSQFGLFVMPILIGILSYLIVKYNSFNVKLFAVDVLVWGLAILIGAQFLFIKSNTNFILNGVTFIGVIIFGFILVKSVKKEIKQKESLQILSDQLFEANEKLKGLDKLKSEFVSLASHQLRSPLTAIKGYASMLVEGDYGEIGTEAKDATTRIFESSQNLAKIVEDLLDVSKIEQGGMKYEMASFDLASVASSMCKDLSIVAEHKGLKLSFLSEGIKDCIVNGDEGKIRQVVLNFIDNSIKYTKTGEIQVKVEKLNNKIIFSVKDTGMGITEEIKETLFHKFARGEGARMNTGGSGLGLYLTKEIVEAHGGRVWVESEGMGKGSTFFMELDAVKSSK